MRVFAAGVLAFQVLVLPLAVAQSAPLGGADEAVRCASSSAPCGFITPVLDLRFPDRPHCPGSPARLDADRCIPLPEDGRSATFQGELVLGWQLTEEVYPMEGPIVVTFAAKSSWLAVRVQPDSFTIEAKDLADPANLRPDVAGPSPVVWFEYRRPIEATFTRTGGPNATESERLENWQGIQTVYLRATSTASGAFYREAYGGEEFRFDARPLLAPPPAEPQGSPGAGLVAVAVVLVSAAVTRARRGPPRP